MIHLWILVFVLIALFFNFKTRKTKTIKNKHAIAVFDSPTIKGTVRFTQESNEVKIDINLTGLGSNRKRGFHIHQFGDMSEQCTSMCAHFNPDNKKHGGLDSKIRHSGDLGNIASDESGVCKTTMYAKGIELNGDKYNILGRGLIIHEDEDDLGVGGKDDSHTTGHAGKRIACTVIGISNS